MALPFQNKKKDAGGIATAIMKNRSPEGDLSEQEPQEEQPEEYSLDQCAADILDAINHNDPIALADSLREAFEKLESEPHEEEGMPSPHTYESQAGEE